MVLNLISPLTRDRQTISSIMSLEATALLGLYSTHTLRMCTHFLKRGVKQEREMKYGLRRDNGGAISERGCVAAFVEPTKAMARNLFAFWHFFISLSSPLPQPAAAFYDPPPLLAGTRSRRRRMDGRTTERMKKIHPSVGSKFWRVF